MTALPDILDDPTRRKLAKVLTALHHPERIRILELLAATAPQAASTHMMVETLGISPANVSHHLKELEAVDIITRKRVNRTMMVESDGVMLLRASLLIQTICKAGGWFPKRRGEQDETGLASNPRMPGDQ